ncbi:hypothetical protein [Streptomyces sp. NPDC055186]
MRSSATPEGDRHAGADAPRNVQANVLRSSATPEGDRHLTAVAWRKSSYSVAILGHPGG